ncbi:RES domain-containing protein [Burkholderia glumae]|uniref:RES family NAD+ phosphorylase n=1 Tax=Burkholderia glumae TaxID=337 RepID=UPI002151F4C5|nr:RES family NAD+ phosphorylase [Burkholderia glumae]UVS84989.1 RES domain-containing protein [Burkholderia glumae]
MTLDECENVFRAVRQAGSISEACFHLTRLFDSYELVSIELKRGETVYWRARSAGERQWPNISDMAYPPAEIAKCGRLNDIGDPCFYAATREETALWEIEAQAEQHVQLAGFRPLHETPIRIAVVGELFHVYKTGYLRLVGTDPDGSMRRLINDFEPNYAKRLLYIDSFLADLLADPKAAESNYMLSRAIAGMIYRKGELDGIMFPSVRDHLGMNLALRASAFDEKMQAVCCFHGKVKRKRSYGFIDYDVLREIERIDDNGAPVWIEAPSEKIRRFFNLSRKEFEAASGGATFGASADKR